MPDESALLWCYRGALRLYPRSYRDRYAGQAMLAARDWQRDTPSVAIFAVRLAWDVLVSLPQEYLNLFWRHFMKRPVIIYSSLLFVLLGGMLVFHAVVDHALLRQTANQPQQQMAERYAQKLSAGAEPSAILPGGRIDIAADLDPFVNFYDDAGKPLAGNGYLDGTLPAPPSGVFAETRGKGMDRLTWMPRSGARIAMVSTRVNGPTPGFIVAGRSLSDTESKEGRVYRNALHGVVLMFLMIGGAGVMLARAAGPLRPA
jgi:hypothetical protein